MPDATEKISVALGLAYHVIDMAGALDACDAAMQRETPVYIATANVDFAYQAFHDRELQFLILHAHRILCDGWPLVWQAGRQGNPLPERVAGSDLLPLLIERCAQKQQPVYFFGSDEDTLARASDLLCEQHEGLNVVGYESPEIAAIHEWDNRGICERINAAQPAVLFIALGCPKQERWFQVNRHRLKVPLSIGIGASLDFVAGKQTRAPKMFQRLGMEWFWRMATDPKRLLGRYTKNIQFFYQVARVEQQALRKQVERRDAPSPLKPFQIGNNSVVVIPADQLDLEQASNSPHEQHTIIDFSQVSKFNYQQLAACVAVLRALHTTPFACAIHAPPPGLVRVMALTHLDEILPHFERSTELEEHFKQVVATLSANQQPISGAAFSPQGMLSWENVSRIETWAQTETRPRLELDLSRVPLIDCNALVRLYELKEELVERDRMLSITQVPEPVIELARRLKLPEDLFDA